MDEMRECFEYDWGAELELASESLAVESLVVLGDSS